MTERVKIAKIQRRGGRVLLKLDTVEEPLSLSEELVHQLRLVEGVVLTESQVRQLRSESELYLCDRQAARMLAMRGYSIGEFKRKLSMKGFGDTVISEVMKVYRRRGVLDDALYAHTLARQVAERKPCGKPYLVAHLRRKLIDRTTAEQAAEMVLAQTDETDRARAALEKRWFRLGQFELETARRKSYNYLVRRGFGYGAAKKAFEAIINQKKEVT